MKKYLILLFIIILIIACGEGKIKEKKDLTSISSEKDKEQLGNAGINQQKILSEDTSLHTAIIYDSSGSMLGFFKTEEYTPLQYVFENLEPKLQLYGFSGYDIYSLGKEIKPMEKATHISKLYYKYGTKNEYYTSSETNLAAVADFILSLQNQPDFVLLVSDAEADLMSKDIKCKLGYDLSCLSLEFQKLLKNYNLNIFAIKSSYSGTLYPPGRNEIKLNEIIYKPVYFFAFYKDKAKNLASKMLYFFKSLCEEIDEFKEKCNDFVRIMVIKPIFFYKLEKKGINWEYSTDKSNEKADIKETGFDSVENEKIPTYIVYKMPKANERLNMIWNIKKIIMPETNVRDNVKKEYYIYPYHMNLKSDIHIFKVKKGKISGELPVENYRLQSPSILNKENDTIEIKYKFIRSLLITAKNYDGILFKIKIYGEIYKNNKIMADWSCSLSDLERFKQGTTMQLTPFLNNLTNFCLEYEKEGKFNAEFSIFLIAK